VGGAAAVNTQGHSFFFSLSFLSLSLIHIWGHLPQAMGGITNSTTNFIGGELVELVAVTGNNQIMGDKLVKNWWTIGGLLVKHSDNCTNTREQIKNDANRIFEQQQ
jgi:hypothetical protein